MTFWRSFAFALFINVAVTDAKRIPSTLNGPFDSVTVPYDVSLRGNAVDLPDTDPRVRRRVKGFEPEQISVSLSPSVTTLMGHRFVLQIFPEFAIILCYTCEVQVGNNIKPLDPNSVASLVRYGRSRFPLTHEATGYSFVYNQLYPFEGLQNYTSGVIHHVRLTDCYDCSFPNTPIHETYQPRWDYWGRFMQSLISKTPIMVVERNLEIEEQAGNQRFVAYSSQFAFPSKESKSSSTFYYTFNAGGIHFIMLGEYLLIVHAYERSNRVYNYTLDPCGPVHITIGDGRNCEKMAIEHADAPGNCPEPSSTYDVSMGGFCPTNFTSSPAAGKFCWDQQPDYSALRESSFGHGDPGGIAFLCLSHEVALKICRHWLKCRANLDMSKMMLISHHPSMPLIGNEN
ncbi:hypothetical protein CRYUN_Cryun01aG0147100 [Craigia yunnanensis]